MMGSGGSPDFIAFKLMDEEENFMDTGAIPKKSVILYEVIGVECKVNGYLTPIEKDQFRWLLQNKIFSKILIASKKDREIVYTEFK